MTNAERQAQYKRRLREQAANGVTPDMIVRATKLSFDDWAKDENETLSWDQILAKSRKPGHAREWQQWVPSNLNDDYAEFGVNAPLMRSVAQVASAVLNPPAED